MDRNMGREEEVRMGEEKWKEDENRRGKERCR